MRQFSNTAATIDRQLVIRQGSGWNLVFNGSLWEWHAMGQPIIDPEGTGPSWTETESEAAFRERLAGDIVEARWLAGPIPVLPAFLAERLYPAHHVDPQSGFLVQDGPDPGFSGDPNAAVIAANYQADVAAWNKRFEAIFAAIRGKVEKVVEP